MTRVPIYLSRFTPDLLSAIRDGMPVKLEIGDRVTTAKYGEARIMTELCYSDHPISRKATMGWEVENKTGERWFAPCESIVEWEGKP